MKNSLLPSFCKRLPKLFQISILVAIVGALSAARAATNSPVLISDAASTRGIALESVTLKHEPFQLTNSASFSADNRTRVALYAMNLDVLAGEGLTAFSADAEDAAHNHYPLNVEFVGQVPPAVDLQGNITTDFRGVYMVIVRLNDAMGDLGDVLVRVNLHGASTNRVRVAIGHVGGGPADDVGAVPTPAPPTPPTPTTPLTVAQYRAQFSNPGPASGPYPDGLRFLEQTTWGPTDADIQHLRDIGMQAYINEQFNTPPVFPSVQSDYPATSLYPQFYPASPPAPPCDATCLRDNYTLYPLQKQFFTNALGQPDQLRQRVSFALHKLIVVAGLELNTNETSWYAPYLQTIDRNSFGNFGQLLSDITLNPGMGQFLNMRGNSVVSQANPMPNENYAREIMQLFSIGVDTLNPDGTPVLDGQGNRVPSYSQADITNLARILTGWDLDQSKPKTWVVDGTTVVANYIDPMALNANSVNKYDLGQKTFFGVNFPACTGASCTTTPQKQAYKAGELTTALNLLFNHQNTGPYLCTQLIHQLVTSNSTPAYVGRCSAAFANNGSGTRGDMKAVITAILLDPEARGDVKNDPNYGHLREPVLLMTNLLRTFNATSDGVLASTPFSYTNDLGQNLFNPPTVFSYFPADYGLPGTSLFGPEFGVLDTSTTFKRANFVNTLFLANSGNGIPISNPNRPAGTQTNYSAYQALAGTPQQLVTALNTRMMHGTMSQSMNDSIVQAVTVIPSASAALRTQTAIYLVATSSQYQVER